MGHSSTGQGVSCEVFDNGQGIDAEAQEKIFDPFFTTKTLGRGLGLSVVSGSLGHGGAITLSSKPNEGTTFRLLLPAFLGETIPALGGLSDAGDWRGSGTTLVAEDEELVREYAAHALEHLGLSELPIGGPEGEAPRGPWRLRTVQPSGRDLATYPG